MSRPIRVHLAGKWAAYVSGYGSRSLLTDLTGRTPRWSAVEGGWATTPAVARDAIAAAEANGRAVVVTDEDQPELLGGDAS